MRGADKTGLHRMRRMGVGGGREIDRLGRDLIG